MREYKKRLVFFGETPTVKRRGLNYIGEGNFIAKWCVRDIRKRTWSSQGYNKIMLPWGSYYHETIFFAFISRWSMIRSGWVLSWIELLLTVTDVSTICAVVIFNRTTLTRTIIFHLLLKWLVGSKHSVFILFVFVQQYTQLQSLQGNKDSELEELKSSKQELDALQAKVRIFFFSPIKQRRLSDFYYSFKVFLSLWLT